MGYTPTMYIATCYASFLAEASGEERSSIILTMNGRKNIIENENDGWTPLKIFRNDFDKNIFLSFQIWNFSSQFFLNHFLWFYTNYYYF